MSDGEKNSSAAAAAPIDQGQAEGAAFEIVALRAALLKLANAADDVGVKFFDTDTMAPEVEAMQAATLEARDALAGVLPTGDTFGDEDDTNDATPEGAARAMLAVCEEYIAALGPDGYHPVPGYPATQRMRRAITAAHAAGIRAEGE